MSKRAKITPVAGGYKVELTPAFLREHAEVLGVCDCGKPAQTATMKDGKFIHECFDCSEKRAPKPAPDSRECKPDHDCYEHATYIEWDGPLGHGWECGKCGALLQVG